jgi:hypothetical protein
MASVSDGVSAAARREMLYFIVRPGINTIWAAQNSRFKVGAEKAKGCKRRI